MNANNISRLSPYSITDDLYRAQLYKEVRDGQVKNEWPVHEVQPSESLRPELIALKVYGMGSEMKWIVMIAAGLDDMRDRIESGSYLRLPSPIWIRERIKHYSAY